MTWVKNNLQTFLKSLTTHVNLIYWTMLKLRNSIYKNIPAKTQVVGKTDKNETSKLRNNKRLDQVLHKMKILSKQYISQRTTLFIYLLPQMLK